VAGADAWLSELKNGASRFLLGGMTISLTILFIVFTGVFMLKPCFSCGPDERVVLVRLFSHCDESSRIGLQMYYSTIDISGNWSRMESGGIY
jgi:hypothetical protein